MKSIRKKVVIDFMLIIIISIGVLEFLLINFVKTYYYNNTEAVLTNQIKISAEFYEKYFSNSTLEDNILDNVDVFWKQTSAQVQVINIKGTILMDSIGVIPSGYEKTSDINEALKGRVGIWIGKVSYSNYKVMAVSNPLKSNGKIVGALRCITSLKAVDDKINKISMVFILIGLIVAIISFILSLFFANSIIEPIKNVTSAAKKMAEGNFNIRSKKIKDDEVGKLSDTLNYMAEEITKREQLKNDFISSVSHELRTPLTAIKGWAFTLNSDDLDDKEMIREGLTIIEKETERLSGMVEELLDFSRFVSERVTLNKEMVDICEFIRYIESYMRPRANRDGISFKVDCNCNMLQVKIDRNRMKQVMINVLDNAFKFTDGYGEVSIKVESDEKYVTICVEDNGCGIPKEELPRVKEKFFKGKSSKSQNGIGLSISDEIVRLHGGMLNIESKVGEGTKIFIMLPLNEAMKENNKSILR